MNKMIKKFLIIASYCFAVFNFLPTINAMEQRDHDTNALVLDVPDFSPMGGEVKCWQLEQYYEQLADYSEHAKHVHLIVDRYEKKQRKRVRIDREYEEESDVERAKLILCRQKIQIPIQSSFKQIKAPKQLDARRCGWFATYLGLIMHEYSKEASSNLSDLRLTDGLRLWILRLKGICKTNIAFIPLKKTLNKYRMKIPANSNRAFGPDVRNLLILHFNRTNLTIPKNITILDPSNSGDYVIKNIVRFRKKHIPQLVLIYNNHQQHWIACVITIAGIWVADSFFQPIREGSSISRNIQRIFRAFTEGSMEIAANLALEIE